MKSIKKTKKVVSKSAKKTKVAKKVKKAKKAVLKKDTKPFLMMGIVEQLEKDFYGLDELPHGHGLRRLVEKKDLDSVVEKKEEPHKVTLTENGAGSAGQILVNVDGDAKWVDKEEVDPIEKRAEEFQKELARNDKIILVVSLLFFVFLIIFGKL